jgi:murein DD-endopeptidase MepM/ murein hydrolase activator NlpD
VRKNERSNWRDLSKGLLVSSLLFIAIGVPGESFLSRGVFVYPLVGTRISSSFGTRTHPVRSVVRHHSGIDLAAPHGSPIRAIQSGVIVFADPHSGYGNLIVISHTDHITSHYGHCDTIRVRPGQRVKAGEIIGTVGSTGLVTGPHLHFELRQNGDPLNPELVIPKLGLVGEG